METAPAPYATPLPTELIRFRSFGSPERNGADESEVFNHLRGRLRFADITTFNDPFEAKPHYVAAYQDAAMQRAAMIRYLTQIAPNGGSKTARRRWAEQRLAGRSQQQLVDEAGEKLIKKDERGNYFVFCLMHPSVVKTPLPWSHYADSHKGVCLHFDSKKRPIKLANSVEYSRKYPTILIPRTEQSAWAGVHNMLLRKASMWKYEKEFRIVRLAFADGIARTLLSTWDGDICLAEAGACKAITFGARMAVEVRERLRDWIRVNTPQVETWQAALHRSRYEVLRTRIE